MRERKAAAAQVAHAWEGGAGLGGSGGRRCEQSVCGGGLGCNLGAEAQRRARAARTRRSRDWRAGGGQGSERTSNIWRMSVTLEVSKLSGWLNALAYCRVERRACNAG